MRLLTALVAVLIAVPLAAQGDRRLARPVDPQVETGRRLALVVGNDRYPAAPLTNARNDARAIGDALRKLGFSVTTVEDVSRSALTSAVVRFGDSLGPSDVALFFFAGHGVQIDGENHLIPVDFQGASAPDVRFNAVRIGEVQYAMQRARVSLLVLDACRNNPFTGARGSSGLAPMEARGSLIAFATGAGETASDNAAGRNGLFTQELLAVLAQPGVTVRDAFIRVRERVYQASQRRQRPAIYEDLLGDVPLTAGVPPTTTPAPARVDAPLRAIDDEGRFWDGVVAERGQPGEPKLLEAYVKQYGPRGRFTIIAEERLRGLTNAVGGATAASCLGPAGEPKALSVLETLEREFVGRQPRHENILGCSGNTRATMIQLNDLQPDRFYDAGDSVYYVLGGEGTLRLKSISSKLVTGDFVSVPRGAAHGFARQGRRPLVLLSLLSGDFNGELCSPIARTGTLRSGGRPRRTPLDGCAAVTPSGTQSVVGLLETQFIGTQPQRETLLACSESARTAMVQLRQPESERRYEDADAMYYVLAGEGALNLNGQESAAGTGTFITIPRGIAHAFAPRGPRPLILLSTVSRGSC